MFVLNLGHNQCSSFFVQSNVPSKLCMRVLAQGSTGVMHGQLVHLLPILNEAPHIPMHMERVSCTLGQKLTENVGVKYPSSSPLAKL